MKSNFVPLEGWWSISINKLFKFPIAKKKKKIKEKKKQNKKNNNNSNKKQKKRGKKDKW